MPCGCDGEPGGKGNEPVGTCTHLSRLKGGGFAIKASGSEFVVAAGFEPALAAFSTPCLFQLGYATVDVNGTRGRTRTG
jgi:hypothetical protein